MHPTTPTKTRLAPTEVAPDTFLVHDHHGEGGPAVVTFNALVIRGQEPVVVDTGEADNRDRYLEDVFSLVEPEDVRWVFISHDDVDHTGNLNALMANAPNATALISWFMVERMGATLEVPMDRWRWIGDGESFDAGDRTLHTVRPPVFDSPTTRGLYDPTTGVYWSSDAFAAPLPAAVPVVDDLDHDAWLAGLATFDNYISPWLALVDDARFQASVDRVAQLDPSVLVGCHTPAIRGDRVADAIATTRRSPTAAYDPQPGQEVLDALLAEAAAA